MKYKVKIRDRIFEVEVGDIQQRPIIAIVEGESFEVWPEAEMVVLPVSSESARSPVRSDAGALPSGTEPPRRSRRTSGPEAAPPGTAARTVYAPIPGVVLSIAVQPGDTTVPGQELCVLEAMKMKNVIRASRTGEVARVWATVGQHVKHHEALIEYVE